MKSPVACVSPNRTHVAISPNVPRSPTTCVSGYTFSTSIGRGTFSTVYKAHRNRGNYEVVAIKCIEISTLSKKSKENLINEINILRRINHQHVVSMKKFTWDAHFIYLIMEYCPGGNLDEFIKKKGKISELIVQYFAQQLVSGLKMLHAENIVHGDLKPANILLSVPPVGSCRSVKLKIADFGYSQQLHSSQDYTSGIKGSPLYMAPEILALQPYTGQADLYSLGVILYECLFGSAPYGTLDFDILLHNVLSEDPIIIPKDIGDSCYDLLCGLLDKDPKIRMNFNELYRHEFIDMIHSPTLENYHKGVNMVQQAILLDNARNYQDAKAYYVEGLLYLVPAYHWLDAFNDNQRKWLGKRVQEYFDRAESLI